MTLKLQYSCTEADMKEANTLQEIDYYGRGSKWRARLYSVGLSALALAGAGIWFTREVAPQERPWVVGMMVTLFAAALVFKWVKRKHIGGEVRLEVSDREVVFGGGEERTAMQWSAFRRLLESANLFVLVHRSRGGLFVVPKRAFPDEVAQNWFRVQANRPQSPVASLPDAAWVGRSVRRNGIALTFRLKFWDYLNRYLTTWRMKGMFFGMLALAAAVSFLPTPPPNAVNSPSKVFLIMVASLMPIMGLVVVFISSLSWLRERRHLVVQQIVVDEESLEFMTQESSGRLPWSTYKYYLENPWSFFIWNPKGSVWFMFPKRAFGSASDLAQFRSMLETKLQKSRWFYL